MQDYYLYDNTITVRFMPTAHRYKVIEPKERLGFKDGVTTPLKLLNKPELLQWAANMAVDTIARAYYDNQFVVHDSAVFEGIAQAARSAHTNYRDQKALLGTKIHYWIEQHIRGQKMPVEKDMQPGVNAYLKWEQAFKPEFLFSERVVYSKEYDYCGTVDAVAYIKGRRTIIDFKTGEPDREWNRRTHQPTGRIRPRLEHLIQTGGYAIPIDEESTWAAQDSMVVYIPVSGECYPFVNPYMKTWRETFLAILDLHRRMKKAGRLNDYERSDALWQ